jgi:hypothetical protein
VNIETPLFFGNPEVVVESGLTGTTNVIGNPGSLTGQQRVSVSAGAGGSCNVFPISMLRAPVVQACQ